MATASTLPLTAPTSRLVSALRMLAAGVVMALAFAMPAQAESDKNAEKFISDLATETLGVLSDKAISEQMRRERFYELLVNNTAVRRFGRSALGQYSRLPTDQEFEDYIDILSQYATLILSSQFTLFVDHTVEVTESTVREQGNTTYVIVGTRVRAPEGKIVATVQWIILRDGPNEFKIFDIRVTTPGEAATFSLLTTQRDEFTQVLRSNGRNVQSLIDYLRQAVADARGQG